MAKLKKKANNTRLSTAERLILAAQEVLKDEKKYCKGRFNEAQLATLHSMIPKKKVSNG